MSKFNQQGFDLRKFEAMKAQQHAEVMNARFNLIQRYFSELVKPNAEATRDKIAASKDDDEKIAVDFSLEAMLAAEMADTVLIAAGLIKRQPPAPEQSEANGEPKSSIIVPA